MTDKIRFENKDEFSICNCGDKFPSTNAAFKEHMDSVKDISNLRYHFITCKVMNGFVPSIPPFPPMISETCSGQEVLSTGARQSRMNVRFDLICPSALDMVAQVCHLGAERHGDYNWTNGIPTMSHINHALGHINKFRAGDEAENGREPLFNLAQAVWRLMAAIHNMTGCEHQKVGKEMANADTKLFATQAGEAHK